MLECRKKKCEYAQIFLDFSEKVSIMKIEAEMLPM